MAPITKTIIYLAASLLTAKSCLAAPAEEAYGTAIITTAAPTFTQPAHCSTTFDDFEHTTAWVSGHSCYTYTKTTVPVPRFLAVQENRADLEDLSVLPLGVCTGRDLDLSRNRVLHHHPGAVLNGLLSDDVDVIRRCAVPHVRMYYVDRDDHTDDRILPDFYDTRSDTCANLRQHGVTCRKDVLRERELKRVARQRLVVSISQNCLVHLLDGQ
ncbi:uncharacterized protein JN550_001185 [Neoarthrinium moseri]|uniref:uncharacterized protein n=1 Tax=Neoarthrinium moseri TaxID=1658444 RepID=UPI001FDE7575|nr:uncharacterized protein JN550_001185 [Neoarthrinium moseri]KAI1877113.1 hypothetical protein JN550_001185 [Neoarthrinium moseri]